MQYYRSILETPLGPMVAIADEEYLYLLEFTDQKRINHAIRQLKTIEGLSAPIKSIQQELEEYFAGKLHSFKTPIAFVGTEFQKNTWKELQKIPYGTTCSYSDLACNLGQPSAYRAAANANGANKLAIIIPCHRVIAADGGLGGYAGGVERKKWLVKIEQSK